MSEKGDFFERVYRVARLIPEGRVTSYGAIARCIGDPRSARMVGWALNGCPEDVPAHRVVNRNGTLTGKHHFFGGMARALQEEGIKVEDDQIVNFQSVFWDPPKINLEE